MGRTVWGDIGTTISQQGAACKEPGPLMRRQVGWQGAMSTATTVGKAEAGSRTKAEQSYVVGETSLRLGKLQFVSSTNKVQL